MNFVVVSKDESEAIRGFIDEEIYEGFSDNNRFAICAVEDDVLCGVGVFDAKKIMDIVDISVLPKYKGKLEQKILDAIIKIFSELPSEAIRMDIYDDPDDLEIEKLLIQYGFLKEREAYLYRFPMSDLYDNERFGMVTDRRGVMGLSDASDRARKRFSNMLFEKGMFEGFLWNDIDQDISTVYVKDDEIMGCVLVRIIDESAFYLEYVYVDEKAPKYALPAMMQESTERLIMYYGDEEPEGFVLATNPASHSLVRKTLQNADMVDRSITYIN